MTERRLRGAWIEAVFGPVPSTLPEGVRMTKSRAWEMCCAAGLRAGIPQHAWVKYHSPHGWMWRTVSYEKIVQREKAMSRRRKR